MREQSSKGKGKTHKSANGQNQSTTGKLGADIIIISSNLTFSCHEIANFFSTCSS
jgi:hypothetical protein